jgi:hypothetical protein
MAFVMTMLALIRGFAILTSATLISACATSSNEIRPSYVSPLQYQSLSCQQIGAEAARVSGRAAELAGVQDSKRTDDQIATGVGAIIFWPTLFLIKGDGQTAAELARLKGEYEALEKIAIEKNCSMQFRSAGPPRG